MIDQSQARDYRVDARSTDVFGRVLCSARTHHFIVDGPAQNGCPGEELTPPEVFLAGVASCGVELIQVLAREGGARVGSVAVQVRAALDRANPLRQDYTVFNSVEVDFRFGGLTDAEAAELVKAFKAR